MRPAALRAGSLGARAAPGRVAALPAVPALLAILVAAGLLLARPAPATAHALLRSSDPAAGATLGSAPASVTLTFGEAPDPRLTSIKVLDSGGADHTSGSVGGVDGQPLAVSVPVGPLGDGVYTVSWRTVSAVDGHSTAGSFVFGVGQAPPTGAPSEAAGGTSQSGSPPGVIARWLLYLGLVALVGVAFVAAVIARGRDGDLLLLAAVGWFLTAAGTIGVVAVQWAESGAPIETLAGSSAGISALARVLSLGIIGAALVALAISERLAGRAGWLLVGIAAALAFLVDVVAGHAAAGSGTLVQVATQWVHGVAAGVWVGGLAALLVALRSLPPEARLPTARHFSSWAAYALAAVALTGVIRAVVEVGTVDALLSTDFGRVVIIKSGLLLALAGLGAINRWVTLTSVARMARGLRRIGSVEIALAIVVLGFTALLVNLTPPTSAGGAPPAGPKPIVASGRDFGTSVRLRLVASPGPAGQNQFDVAVTDYDSGEPLDASSVALRFQLASQAGVGPSTLDLQRTAAGRFGASGANLSIDGIWRVTATVTAPSGAVEIPLVVATSIDPQPTQATVTPGLPTIYTVQLGPAGSAQVYLDPGGAGPNELHVTFFDASGAELPLDTATIAVFPAGGDSAILAPRLLEPGHFVASHDATAGALGVDVIAPPSTTAGTAQIHVHVVIEVQP